MVQRATYLTTECVAVQQFRYVLQGRVKCLIVQDHHRKLIFGPVIVYVEPIIE